MKWTFVLAVVGIAASAASSLGQSPAPVITESGVSLLIPPNEFAPPNPPIFGSLQRITPAHRLAMLEANRSLYANDPLVKATMDRLERLTGQYIEDAPRIVELTARVVNAVRASNRPASPFEILDGALASKSQARPGETSPRRYQRYMSDYRRLRVDEKKAHGDALAIMQGKRPG